MYLQNYTFAYIANAEMSLENYNIVLLLLLQLITLAYSTYTGHILIVATHFNIYMVWKDYAR